MIKSAYLMQSLYMQVIFLNQIDLSHRGEGRKVAKLLIDIYFALFKAMYGHPFSRKLIILLSIVIMLRYLKYLVSGAYH